MKKTTILIIIFISMASHSFGQKTDELFSVRVGYSSTSINFKEAFQPSVGIFGFSFNTGKTFGGDGIEMGISKSINNNLFGDIAFSTFSGQERRLAVNNTEYHDKLTGFQIPLTVNYLLRHHSKRFRINVDGGFQYLKAHLAQFEKNTVSSGQQTTTRITAIEISEFQVVIRPGVQFRIVPNLVASFIPKIGISTNGRYLDHPCLSSRYTFMRKK